MASDGTTRVQMLRVAEIASAWEAAGSPPCQHRTTAAEYYRDDPTGDTVCLGCGDAWPREAAAPRPSGAARAGW